MSISYDAITNAFLSKITEFELLQLPSISRKELVDGYMKRAATAFKNVCQYDLTAYDDTLREFTDDFDEADVDEILDIISEGMAEAVCLQAGTFRKRTEHRRFYYILPCRTAVACRERICKSTERLYSDGS